MPFLDKQARREYGRKWVAARRAAWFAGKCCAICGSTARLELDHIDPAQKVDHKVWSWSEKRRNEELSKCRPLCYSCHKSRSAEQRRTPAAHGTTAGYRRMGCRCDLCRQAMSTYRANLKKLRQSA